MAPLRAARSWEELSPRGGGAISCVTWTRGARRFRHHSAPRFEDFDVTVPAEILGSWGFVFTRTNHSWHGVREIHCPEGHMRKVFIVVLNKADPIYRLKARLFGKGFERF